LLLASVGGCLALAREVFSPARSSRFAQFPSSAASSGRSLGSQPGIDLRLHAAGASKKLRPCASAKGPGRHVAKRRACRWISSLWEQPALPQVLASFECTHLMACLLVDLLAIAVLKTIFKRARPSHHKTDFRFVGPDVHSFPSGHATRCWAMLGTLFFLASTSRGSPQPLLRLALCERAQARAPPLRRGKGSTRKEL
jgi:hypothetical protein